MDAKQEVLELAQKAKAASRELGLKTEAERNAALFAMADALRGQASRILQANAADVAIAQAAGTKESLIDRLLLNEERIAGIAKALEDLADLPDPLGRTIDEREMYNGIDLKRVSVPLGVVAMIYEARPNVTADAAGICLKSGNAVVLRGGSMAAKSCQAMAEVLSEAAISTGMPEGCINIVTSTSREATDELMQLHGLIDVLIPRGGAGLIRHCVEHSRVPVIETGTGNCHTYIHGSADLYMAVRILVNAKTQRMGVCNACESLLVDRGASFRVLPMVAEAFEPFGIIMHVDAEAKAAIGDSYPAELLVDATEEDWGREYLGPEISVHVLNGVEEAVAHINEYGTGHSECIVCKSESAADYFTRAVDAAAVYVNASTRFTDGGEFGLGAEIGISTQKLHVRGPFALEALTSSKYVLYGGGQVRG